MTAIPRLVIAAPSSGHGKTAVSVGLLAAFAGRGLTVTGFKVGTDYVDAGYLGLASGRPGRNLDPRLQGVDRVAPLFAHGARGSDIALVEGTMGLYDDLAGGADGHSTAEVAGLLKAPVVLALDASAIGQSVGALVHGFRSFDELLWLGGVILAGVASDRHEQILRGSLDDLGVPVLGVLRRRSLAPLPQRQCGVAPVVDRSTEAVRAVRRLGSVVASSVELERMVALARSAPDLGVDEWSATAALASGSSGPATRQLRPSVGHRALPARPARQPAESRVTLTPAGEVGTTPGPERARSTPTAEPVPAGPVPSAAGSSAAADAASSDGPASGELPAAGDGASGGTDQTMVGASRASGPARAPEDPSGTPLVSCGSPEASSKPLAFSSAPPAVVSEVLPVRPVVAVAGGATFSYSYPETIELLDAAGVEVAPFDPLRDEQLPDGVRGVVIGGAFPELYADELSANEPLCREVAEMAFRGTPIVAESAGLLWLVKEFDGRPMCGVLNASAQSTNTVVLGYRSAIARASSPLTPLGAAVVGHKSHRAVVTPRSGDNAAWQWRGGRPEGFVWRNVHASFLNLHWAGHPEIAKRFRSALG